MARHYSRNSRIGTRIFRNPVRKYLARKLEIVSIGLPCVPEEVWNGCEPVMTIIPNFLITGILVVIISMLILMWSVLFIQRSYGFPVWV
jgi:hypothetical protein